MSTTDCGSDTNPLPSKSSSSDYVITDALKAPRATTYTAQALFDQIMNGDIDLDPEYQRGPLFLLFCLVRAHSGHTDIVWPEAKQVGLIDSIFRNFYIPPVIFCTPIHPTPLFKSLMSSLSLSQPSTPTTMAQSREYVSTESSVSLPYTASCWAWYVSSLAYFSRSTH